MTFVWISSPSLLGRFRMPLPISASKVHFIKTIARAKIGDESCLYIRRSLRPRECIEHAGSVVVFGNVERDCTIKADGDIIVLGNLLGKCHAGRKAEIPDSKIFALRMGPSEIKIGENIISPCQRGPFEFPEVAFPLLGMISFSPFYGNYFESTSLWKFIKLASRPAKAALFTGAYIFLAGLAFLVYPRTLFGLLFSLENVEAGWIQAGAVLGMVFGIYYIGTALGDVHRVNGALAFYFSTVVGRIFLFCSFLCLVISGASPTPLLLIGIINLAGALWMLHTLGKC